ncbi:hypothetical protein QWY84_19180 [Aquisalimonas lutea]|uniref:hypothetical protein n=1 Tax=Pseudomonadota TaxID=1224 RepID=UPI0025B4195A|nr:hypothetical protein [Aquisalimonas lutea]MDN3519736.1 hypothetical protein [Aquisalimonas lutea]
MESSLFERYRASADSINIATLWMLSRGIPLRVLRRWSCLYDPGADVTVAAEELDNDGALDVTAPIRAACRDSQHIVTCEEHVYLLHGRPAGTLIAEFATAPRERMVRVSEQFCRDMDLEHGDNAIPVAPSQRYEHQ